MNSEKQKGLILMVSESFLAVIDENYRKLGYRDRATFVRAAVHKYLTDQKIKVPEDVILAKSGGGRPKKQVTKAKAKTA